MRILIVWACREPKKRMRNAILDYVEAFPKYDKDNHYFYLNLVDASSGWDYSWIKDGMFDAILFTCTFLGIRWRGPRWSAMWDMCEKTFGPLSCRKVLMPQDDYDNTAKLWDFIRRVGITDIYTVMSKADYDIVYPKKEIGNCRIKTVLTGYVDDRYLNMKFPEKSVDVIYRANKLSYKFGMLGQQKTDLISAFSPRLTDLKIDIKNTVGNKGVYYGDDWIMHLAMARCVLGCPSGSSIIDKDGEIGERFDEYLRDNPEASYEKAKSVCFPDMNEPLHGVISPRHLEAAITKTCQILIRGDYSDALEADIDYIPLEPDYSNIDEVIDKIKNVDYCKVIAENCYRHVIESRKYTYDSFVKETVADLSGSNPEEIKHPVNKKIIKKWCAINNRRAACIAVFDALHGDIREYSGINRLIGNKRIDKGIAELIKTKIRS